VGAAAAYYLRSIPTAGHDVSLYAVLIGIGLLLGLGNGLFSKVYEKSAGKIFAQSGLIAALFWIIGMAARSVFIYYADHGGAHELATFSRNHEITGAAAWTAGLVFMALVEVLIRLAVLRIRGYYLSENLKANTSQLNEFKTEQVDDTV
jgi:hypothetical protein